MNSPIITKKKVELNLADEVSSFTVRVGAVACGAIGIGAVVCLVAAFLSAGPVEMMQGYITAVTGF